MDLMERHNEPVFMFGFWLQMVVVHVMTIVGFVYLFSWQALAFAAAVAIMTGHAFAIFYHSLLTHRAFQCASWFKNAGVVLAALYWRGPFANPIRWITIHKLHHSAPDTPLDVHSPANGIWRALLGWFWRVPRGFSRYEYYERYAAAAVKTPWIVWVDHNVHLIQLIWAGLCVVLGGFIFTAGAAFDAENAWRFFVFGVFVKTLIITYLGNLLDILNHAVGYRNYETRDDSRNSKLLSLLVLGGVNSWHNNHHAHPNYVHVRHRWWEFDPHYVLLKALEALRVVSAIKVRDELRGA